MSTLYTIGQMNQLGDAFEKAGFSQDDVTKLRSCPDLLGTIKQVFSGTMKLVIEVVKLLTKFATLQVPDASEFVLNDDKVKEANIGYMWNDFKKHFLNKKCPSAKASTYASHRLEKNSLDKPILAELGDHAETTMAHFIWLISQQSKGQDGFLLTNSRANIFYIKDDAGTLWTVFAYFFSARRDWHVNAFSVEDPHGWHAGNQVLSRDC